MAGKKTQIFLTTLALILVAVVPGFIWYKNAASEAVAPVDWMGLPPTISKISDLSEKPSFANKDCTKAKLQVARGLAAPFEEHCFVPTAMGLIEQEGGVVQPNGYTKAYPLVYGGGGNPVTLPIPNQAAALSLSGTGANDGTAYLSLYRSLHSHLKFDLPPDGPRFRIATPPDYFFRYDNGSPVFFNYLTLAHTQGGRYTIVDTVYNGFARIDLLNLTMQPIAGSLPIYFNGLAEAATALENSGKYAAIAFYRITDPAGPQYFKIIDVKACTGSFNQIGNAKPVFSCPTVDLRPKIAQAVPNLRDIYNVRFVNDRTVTFVAGSGTATTGYKYARYSMTAGGQKINLVQYLALGDSYISGEGAHSYREGTDTGRNGCHQSLLSYPYLLSKYASSFASVACSGARSNNIVKTGSEKTYQVSGEVPTATELNSAIETHEPGVALQEVFVAKDNPEAITISIGGNDIGFGEIIKKCVHPLKDIQQNLATDHTCYPTYEDRLEVVNTIRDRLPKLRELYKGFRDSGTGTRRVYVIGYPQVAKVDGDCGLNVQLNADEVRFARDLIAYLNTVIKQAADEAGVVYVDTQTAFDGNRLCEGLPEQSAMNGFTISKNSVGDIDVTASFHPNKTGHQKLAAAVGSQTFNLTRAMPIPVAVASQTAVDLNLPILQNAPKTNRPIRNVQVIEPKNQIVFKGSQLDMVINGRDYYTKPGGKYNVVMQSTPIDMGLFTADADGNVTVATTIPSAVEPGFHTIHIYGNDVFGGLIDLQQIVYVAATAEDYDSDGISNNADSCVLVTQSGVDMDVDGTDDACDPLVTATPVAPPQPDGIVWRDDAVLSIEIQAISGQ